MIFIFASFSNCICAFCVWVLFVFGCLQLKVLEANVNVHPDWHHLALLVTDGIPTIPEFQSSPCDEDYDLVSQFDAIDADFAGVLIDVAKENSELTCFEDDGGILLEIGDYDELTDILGGIVGFNLWAIPTTAPTDAPTLRPTDDPTPNPTENPTPGPTNNPTQSPSVNPTQNPTNNPTPGPTNNPTKQPSQGDKTEIEIYKITKIYNLVIKQKKGLCDMLGLRV